MSVMVGSPGSKFINQDTSSEKTPFREVNLLPKQLKNSAPHRAYQGLRVSPEMTLEFEDNQALPTDSSQSMLRNLSPFILNVELPTALANLTNANSSSKATGLYDAAFNANGNNNSASQAVSQQVWSGDKNLAGSVDDAMTSQGVNSNAKGGEKMGRGKLGEPSIADLKSALDIVTQANSINMCPPLVLLINPSNLSMNYTRIHQFSDRSRFGYIYQAWGE